MFKSFGFSHGKYACGLKWKWIVYKIMIDIIVEMVISKISVYLSFWNARNRAKHFKHIIYSAE